MLTSSLILFRQIFVICLLLLFVNATAVANSSIAHRAGPAAMNPEFATERASDARAMPRDNPERQHRSAAASTTFCWLQQIGFALPHRNRRASALPS
jgi:hypothetical protein